MLLEIEVDGARQVVEKRADACVILLVPPSIEVQTERLRARGDHEDHVQVRVAEGQSEIALARAFATVVVVNDELDTAVAHVAGIIEQHRRA